MRPRPQPQSQSQTQPLPDLTGTRIAHGRLRLLACIGQGGFARVYRAARTDGGAPCAVKCLHGPFAAALAQHERAMHARVAHVPGVLRVVPGFLDEKAAPPGTLVLELCARDLLQAITAAAGAVPPGRARVRETFVQLLDAVQGCHAAGVFHRDVKPQNVLLGADGRVRLADFGLATTSERSGQFRCGSRAYMSPECLRVDCNADVYSTRQTDLWALGVVLVNIVTGRYPWMCADGSDARFVAFSADPAAYLQRTLRLTRPLVDLLCRVFHPEPTARPSLAEMRRGVLAVPSFAADAAVSRDERAVVVCSGGESSTMDAELHPSVLSLSHFSLFTSILSVATSFTSELPPDQESIRGRSDHELCA
ncbi:unnamed protein product [Mycena citricolor]|uniref:non-specific serine/threonine protein kinase n=1 Tax=Mycena citricolor TaxID=2018698 RepID=A0AAD2HBC5_9AGAR|nr:unnamed protein product [Mycena citricolor]